MTKLNKASLTYLHILFVIWSLFDYYCNLFKIDVPDDPTELSTEIFESDGMTFVRFSFQKIPAHSRQHTVFQMSEILNEYLQIVLLPSQSFLKPYKNSSAYYDLIEPLYIDTIFEDKTNIFVDILLIDSPLAFKHVRNFENLKI